MAERVTISFSIENMITVTIMVAIMFAVSGFLYSLIKSNLSGPSSDA